MMKIRALVFGLLASTALFAQAPKYGLKAGLNLATITNTDGELKAGFHGGALAHIHLTPAFSLQPEVMYSNQGTKVGSDNKLLLNYINVPLLLQYNFDNGFRLQGGPQIGFLLEAKSKSGNVETDVSGSYKAIDFSIPVGASYLGYSGFGVDARYNIGVTNVVETSALNYRNSVLQFGVFYLFDHHHKARSK
ncbi:MAG TPA: porin family protein [Flavisolibacter sp.]|jgi:hypothetical protein